MADRIAKFDLFVILIKKETTFNNNFKFRSFKQYFLYSEIKTVITV